MWILKYAGPDCVLFLDSRVVFPEIPLHTLCSYLKRRPVKFEIIEHNFFSTIFEILPLPYFSFPLRSSTTQPTPFSFLSLSIPLLPLCFFPSQFPYLHRRQEQAGDPERRRRPAENESEERKLVGGSAVVGVEQRRAEEGRSDGAR
ncbi:hypothetical protein Dimus_038279 [Dionaea muscipula]